MLLGGVARDFPDAPSDVVRVSSIHVARSPLERSLARRWLSAIASIDPIW